MTSTKTAAEIRRKQLVWPREHGAWGMLFVPLATGAALGFTSGGEGWPVALFVVSSFALFCLRTPVESLWGTSPIKAVGRDERRFAFRYALAFSFVAALALAVLLALGLWPGLMLCGAVAAVLFLAQAIVRQWRRQSARMGSQMLGALGLTLTAPVAYYVSTGSLDARAVALWLANWVFAGNQIHFVQLRLHASKASTFGERMARGRAFFSGQLAMVVLLVLAWQLRFLPLIALLAFVPVAVRGWIWFFAEQRPLNLRRLGFTELAHAIAFGALLIISFRLS